MKALLLSAGLGTRLRPITESIPKVMVKVNGKPCLEYHIENLKAHGIEEIAVNTHYKPEMIKSYFKDGKEFGVDITYSYEPELLGTAGALNNFRNYFDEVFTVIYGDVLASFDISSALEVHNRNNSIATIILDNRDDIKGKGFVKTNGEKVEYFVERPKNPIPGAAINSGCYILDPKIIREIPEGFCDFPTDIFPDLVKRGLVYGSLHKGYVFDIGTRKLLDEAESYMKKSS